MKPITVAILAIAASQLLMPSIAAAQSTATVYDVPNSESCMSVDTSSASSGASCGGSIAGGVAAASSAADRAARTARASGSLIQTGASNSMDATLVSDAFVYSMFTLSGMQSFSQQTNLVFHFDASETNSARAGSPNDFDDFGLSGLYLSTTTGSAWHYTRSYVSGNVDRFYDDGVTITPTGLDYIIGNTLGNGSHQYYYYVQSYEQLRAREDPGTEIISSFNAFLRGIDLTDAQGTVLASATFDVSGAATLDATTAPEPAAVVLMAFGLVIVGFMKATLFRRARVFNRHSPENWP